MKHSNLKLAGIVVFSLLSVSTFSQNFWQKGGNAQVPPAAPPILGTDASWNAPLRIHTNGIQRMFLNTGNGFTGLGNNFSNPLSLLHVNGVVLAG